MEFTVQSLEPHIRAILSAPDVNLDTISAKRVRSELAAQNSETLTPRFLKENKQAIDAVIASVFASISEHEDEQGDPSRKRKPSSEEPETDGSPPRSPKKAKQAPQKKQPQLSDAEIARQLSNEINGRPSRRGSAASMSTSKSPKKTTARNNSRYKSAALVMSDGDSDSPPTTKRKRSKAATTSKEGAAPKTSRGGFSKEYVLSAPLSAVLNAEKMSRPQVVKNLWAYIKANELQNPSDKREILCDRDPLLRAVFKADKIGMFQMNVLLSLHLHDDEGN